MESYIELFKKVYPEAVVDSYGVYTPEGDVLLDTAHLEARLDEHFSSCSCLAGWAYIKHIFDGNYEKAYESI